jgi:hypothetical protein
VFCKLAFGDLDLAPATDRPTTANGVDIHAQAASSVQDWRRTRKPASLARGHEDDQGIIFAFVSQN